MSEAGPEPTPEDLVKGLVEGLVSGPAGLERIREEVREKRRGQFTEWKMAKGVQADPSPPPETPLAAPPPAPLQTELEGIRSRLSELEAALGARERLLEAERERVRMLEAGLEERARLESELLGRLSGVQAESTDREARLASERERLLEAGRELARVREAGLEQERLLRAERERSRAQEIALERLRKEATGTPPAAVPEALVAALASEVQAARRAWLESLRQSLSSPALRQPLASPEPPR